MKKSVNRIIVLIIAIMCLNLMETSFINIGDNICYATTYTLATPKVKIDNDDEGYIKLSWAKIDKAKSYDIYRATSKNGSFKKIYNTKKTKFTNKSIKSGKTYYYKIKALPEKGSKIYKKSKYSNTVKGKLQNHEHKYEICEIVNAIGKIENIYKCSICGKTKEIGEHDHSYIDGKCIYCGDIDYVKTLSINIEKKGKESSRVAGIYELYSNDKNANLWTTKNSNYIAVTYYVNAENCGGIYTLTKTGRNGEWKYTIFRTQILNGQLQNMQLEGKIDAETFSEEQPLIVEKWTGDNSFIAASGIMEAQKTGPNCIWSAIFLMDKIMKENNIDISIKDLGFKNFK